MLIALWFSDGVAPNFQLNIFKKSQATQFDQIDIHV